MKKRNGFTLLEMLVVIGIIAILGGVMLAQFSGSTESALATSCMNNMRSLCNAVMADGSKEGYFPSAGPYKYIELAGTSVKTEWFQGWIGHAKGESKVSCYHSGMNEDQHYAITNGTVWRGIGGLETAYVCPSHLKYCKRGKMPTPSWSYVMNSYFGWDYGTAGSIELGRRKYGSGFFTFSYSSSPTSRKRPLEKVLLFAEIPYAENGVQKPQYSTSASENNDAILQYGPDSKEVKKSDKTAAQGTGEVIGFNHKSGDDYSAHVAFADGHCTKLLMPRRADEGNLRELTTWLCTGQEYTFNGSRYEKVSE